MVIGALSRLPPRRVFARWPGHLGGVFDHPFAFAAWRAGQGALAMVALERALEARSDYSMALLLAEVLHNGIAPTTLDGWRDQRG